MKITTSKFLEVHRPQRHVIAYLDMLGTTVKITHTDDYSHLRRLHEIYNTAVQIIQDKSHSTSYYDKVTIKIFSDNIILAIPLNANNDIEDIHNLIQFAAIFQGMASVYYNWPVRGGITIGDLFLDEIMVWGEGLIRAYNLENQTALFPRIVVDQSIIHMIGKNNNYVRRDFDGWFFVDFLNFIHSQDEQKHPITISFQKSFTNQLKEIRNPDGTYQERPYQKLQWYKSYLNQWYKEHYSPVEGTVLIDESTLDENEINPRENPS